jgi:hypothetical protein
MAGRKTGKIRKSIRASKASADKTVDRALSKRGVPGRKSLKPKGRVLMPRPMGPKGKGKPKRKK